MLNPESFLQEHIDLIFCDIGMGILFIESRISEKIAPYRDLFD